MELFTLGIGNYTEDDIKQSARAFTGWTARDGEFIFDERRHDPGMKTIFGITGPFDGDQVIDMIVSKPVCAEFICKKLCKYFMYDDPEPELVSGLAKTFREYNYEIKPVMRQMFLSQAFYQDKAIDSLIKSPAQLVVGLMVQLGAEIDPSPPVAQLAIRAMGQSLFYPPNVKGWDGGRAWINTNTLLIRYNFANYLVSGVVPDFGSGKGYIKPQNLRRRVIMAAMGKDGGAVKAMTRGDSMDASGGGMDGPGMSMDAGGSGMDGPGMAMDAGTSVTGKEARARDVPAGQDAMPSDVPSKTLYTALNQKKAAKRKMAKVPEKDRLKTLAMENAPFDAREFFMQFKGQTSEQIIDRLVNYFIGFPLEDAQEYKLTQVLAQAVPPGMPVPVEKMSEGDLRATVQLLLSTVEYQVC
jgi:hypothetical protein